MRAVTRLWGNFYAGLGQVNMRHPSKNPVIHNTMRPARYKERANMIINKLAPQDSILEIGCGFGGLASEILKLTTVKYTAVDNEPMLTQAKRLLDDKVEYVDAEKIETLQDRKFGLFISHFCLSETPPEYREYVLKNIIKNCQKIFVIDYSDEVKPTHRMLEDGYEVLPMKIEEWIEKYFIVEKTKLSKKTTFYVYIGERRK